jgi:predicted HD phosphohydrolase
MDAVTREKKKRLLQSPKGDLAERLLFAYSTIQSLEAERLQLTKALYLAANDFTSSNGTIPEWWRECKEIARKTLELEGAKNTEQQVQADSSTNSLT